MSATVGRLRPCGLLDWKFSVLSHNTIRGAAGASEYFSLPIADNAADRGGPSTAETRIAQRSDPPPECPKMSRCASANMGSSTAAGDSRVTRATKNAALLSRAGFG